MGFDERPVALRGASRPGRPMRAGRLAREDYEYVRRGTANIYCIVEPKAGRQLNRTRLAGTTHDALCTTRNIARARRRCRTRRCDRRPMPAPRARAGPAYLTLGFASPEASVGSSFSAIALSAAACRFRPFLS